ncbi:unnamed protein product [Rotaria sp. Silwood1]|nr:unnamed protein product [Rotaria sp. Silwood1]
MSHPLAHETNLVTVYGCLRSPHHGISISMEYVSKSLLTAAFANNSTIASNLSIRERLHIALGMTKGLNEMHLVQLTHRDFKPENVLLSRLFNDLISQKQKKLEKETFLTDEPISPEEDAYYTECKQYYHITKTPLISTSDEIFKNDIELKSSTLKFAIDVDYSEFVLQKFLNKICNMLDIDIDDIDIKKIQKGCVVLEMEIFKKIDSKLQKLKILFKTLTNKVRKELGKLKIYFMFMGDITSLNKKQKFRNAIKLHPEWNLTYAKGHTYWEGALNDGIDRGNQPYYCPVGWKRYALYVTDHFPEKFKGWCKCYHGTKFSYGLSILLCGLKPADRAQHGNGIYATPSIIYACHPRYSEIKRIITPEQKKVFKSGEYIQFVLECRVHPTSIKRIAEETLGASDTIIDSNISNNIIEWVIDDQNKDIVDFNDPDASIVCTGLMIRVTDNHPGLLPESDWWFKSHLCNTKRCCCLDIDLDELKQQKNKAHTCNIVYE